MGYKKEEQMSSLSAKTSLGVKDILAVIIYSSQSSNRLAKVKQIVLPKAKNITLVDDSHAKQPQIRATIRFVSHCLSSPFSNPVSSLLSAS